MAQVVNKIGTITAENRIFYERALLKRLLPALHAYNDAQKYTLPENSGTNGELAQIRVAGDTYRRR